MTNKVRLGTRSSPLARWQADWIAARLAERDVDVEMVYLTTAGDAAREAIGSIGGQGVFTKEIQRALMQRTIDLAVHSLKDLPTEKVAGLILAAVPPRERQGDVLVTELTDDIMTLPQGARVGTGSLRRCAQLLQLRPDLQVLDIRGNVDTRLRKLDEGLYDALVLAEAGLLRLGLEDRIAQRIPWPLMLPAVGQGALALEVREYDEAIRAVVEPLDDPATHQTVKAERQMLRQLRGGCLAPVGAWGRVEQGLLKLDGVVLSADGRQRLDAFAEGPLEQATEIGTEVAEQLRAKGADRLIAQSRAL